MSRPVGIDLGTTYSVVSTIDQLGKTIVVPNQEGDNLTPSVVLFEDERTVVGKEARRQAVMRSGQIAACAKRDMGSKVYSQPIRGKYLPPEVIQACILRKLKADAAAGVGPDFKAVITVPAFFDEPRRKATADAGQMAGLQILDIVNEPTAAALAFGETHGYLSPSGAPLEAVRVLVYDLGGGTFDVTLIEIEPGNVRTLATDGDVRLGGRDWDFRLVDYAAEAYIKRFREDPRQNPSSLAKLLNEAEEAKHTLSVRKKTNISIEHGGTLMTIEVSRDTFESLTADLLERTRYTMKQLVAHQNFEWRDINRVLLVGGSTRMPMVTQMIEQVTGLPTDRSVHPDEAVARGAAIYAAHLMATRDTTVERPKYTVTNVSSHSLGVEGIDVETRRRQNAIVLPRNSGLPAAVTRTFTTKHRDQRSVVIQVLEGESPSPAECAHIGRAVIRGLPRDLPQGWPVDVTFEYATNGRLSVSGRVTNTDREVKLVLERDQGLTNDHVKSWARGMSGPLTWNDFEAILDVELGVTLPKKKKSPDELDEHDTNASLVGKFASLSGIIRGKKPHAAPPAPSGNPAVVGGAAAAAVPAPATAPGSSTATATATRPAPAAPLATSQSAAPGPQPMQTNRPGAAPQPAKRIKLDASQEIVETEERQLPMFINIGIFLICAAVGLLIGYYILCWITPEGNFLGLNLPGLPE